MNNRVSWANILLVLTSCGKHPCLLYGLLQVSRLSTELLDFCIVQQLLYKSILGRLITVIAMCLGVVVWSLLHLIPSLQLFNAFRLSWYLCGPHTCTHTRMHAHTQHTRDNIVMSYAVFIPMGTGSPLMYSIHGNYTTNPIIIKVWNIFQHSSHSLYGYFIPYCNTKAN